MCYVGRAKKEPKTSRPLIVQKYLQRIKHKSTFEKRDNEKIGQKQIT